MHASELWKRFGAGRHYEEYLKREAQVGRSHPSIETVEASPNTIALAYRLAGDGNWVFADSLMTDILDGKIRRADLNDAWKAVKEAKSEAAREKNAPRKRRRGFRPRSTGRTVSSLRRCSRSPRTQAAFLSERAARSGRGSA